MDIRNCLRLVITWVSANVAIGSTIFNQDQVNFFQREGYIKVSGLLDEALVNDLANAAADTIETSPKFPFFYSVSQSGLLFGSTTNRTRSATEAYRQAAIHSKFPQAVAELMQLDSEKHNLRVLRDVFLARSVEDPESCDWHVDDVGFWPESFSSGEHTIDGVNVWVALDEMPASFQGSMAVAPRSHKAQWRHRAYLALGQNRSQDGGKTKEEVLQKLKSRREQSMSTSDASKTQKKSKYPTCDIRLVDPAISVTLDASQRVFDLKRGDVIISTRLLFHRSMPVTDAGVKYYTAQGQKHLSRYSIRYVTGAARLPQGWSVEWSVVDDSENAGRSLDTVADQGNKMFYPQVWPTIEDSMPARLKEMEDALPSLTQRAQDEYMATIFGAASEH